MPRNPRTDHPGAIHFVTNRGTAQTMIYRSDRDRRLFLSLLGELGQRFLVRVLAYVLMSNHYHLILASEHGRLSEALHFLNGNHASWFNSVHGRTGTLFQGRYDARLIGDEAQLERAGAYLHLNPSKAGLVENPVSYPWSSLGAYKLERSSLDWLHLDLLGGRSGPHYVDDVLAASGEVRSIPDDDDSIHAWCVDEGEATAHAFHESDLVVARAFKVSVDELYIPAVGRRNLARTVAIVRAAQEVERPLAEVALHYGLRHVNAVHNARARLRRATAHDPALADHLRSIGIILRDRLAG